MGRMGELYGGEDDVGVTTPHVLALISAVPLGTLEFLKKYFLNPYLF